MPTKNLAERFWSKVDRRGPDECWPWTGCIDPDGYGRFSVGGRSKLAHRVAYTLTIGDPPGTLDHTCHDPRVCEGGPTCPHRSCCNPAHVTGATRGENAARGAHGKVNRNKTECARGHQYDEANTYYRKDGGGRSCRTCTRERKRREYIPRGSRLADI